MSDGRLGAIQLAQYTIEDKKVIPSEDVAGPSSQSMVDALKEEKSEKELMHNHSIVVDGMHNSAPSTSNQQPIVTSRRVIRRQHWMLGNDNGEPFAGESLVHRREPPQPPAKRGRRSMVAAFGVEDMDAPNARTEAARRSGRPTIKHPSGIEFALPISLEAHPIALSDKIPDNPAHDILKEDQGLPYCSACHCVLKSWAAVDYHIMHVHLKYRSYRCIYCLKEYFYTEDEVSAHIRSQHPGRPVHYMRELNDEKEQEASKYYQALFVMIREGNTLTEDRLSEIQKTAFNHVQRFHRMRFKLPEVVARQKSQRDGTAQTNITMASPHSSMNIVRKPVIIRAQAPWSNDFKLVRLSNGEYAQLIPEQNDRFMMDREMENGEPAEFDQINVVDEELIHQHPHY